MNKGTQPSTPIDFKNYSFGMFLLKNQSLISVVSSTFSSTLTSLSVSLPSSGTYMPLCEAVYTKGSGGDKVALYTPSSTSGKIFNGESWFSSNFGASLSAIIKNAFSSISSTGVGYSNFYYSDYYYTYTYTNNNGSENFKEYLVCSGGESFNNSSCFQINLYYIKIS